MKIYLKLTKFRNHTQNIPQSSQEKQTKSHAHKYTYRYTYKF